MDLKVAGCGVWLCLLLGLSWNSAGASRPVLLFHGIFSSSLSMEPLVRLIKDNIKGKEVYNIDGFDDLFSTAPVWKQVSGIRNKMLPIMEKSPDGVDLICYSQGGLVCRGILETTPTHNVRTFISLSSPQAGQFGVTEYMKYLFPNFTTNNLYRIAYTTKGQKISVANYWRDPHHQDLYKEFSRFLYPINHPSDSSSRSNFDRLDNLVLIGGPNDGVINPWQSSHFAFYDKNNHIVEMEKQDYYQQDTFGLQTLQSKGKIHEYSIPGVKHLTWQSNKAVFDCCIAPYLKE